MAGDTFTEVTKQGFGSRIGNSIKGIIFGIIFFFGSFVLLWWNEGNLVRHKQALKEMGQVVVAGNASSPSPLHNGKLIHTSAKLESGQTLSDPMFLQPGAYLIINRNVEMYQWVEEEKSETREKLGGGTETVTTYSYSKKWEDEAVNSSNFKKSEGHENPSMPFGSQTMRVTEAAFGAFDGMALVERLSADEALKLSKDIVLETAPPIQGDYLYQRRNPASQSDEIGDIRVSFKVLRPNVFSIMATQADSSRLIDYQASNGKSLFLIGAGTKSSQELLETERNRANLMAWILRGVGAFAMWLGIVMVLNPLAVLLSVLPPLGGLGRGFIFLVSFVLTAVLSISTILIAMIFYNVWALVITIVLVFGLTVWWLKKKSKTPGGLPIRTAAAVPPPAPVR